MVNFETKFWKISFWIRLFYLIPTILLTIGIYNAVVGYSDSFNSFLGLFWIIIIAWIVFIYQLIRNSLTGWILIVILYLAYLTMLLLPISEFIDLYGVKYGFKSLIVFILVRVGYLGIGYILWKIRPKKRIV